MRVAIDIGTGDRTVKGVGVVGDIDVGTHIVGIPRSGYDVVVVMAGAGVPYRRG